jgi:hypothetical protein
MRRRTIVRAVSWLFTITLLAVVPLVALAETPGSGHFDDVWSRTDEPVAQQIVERSWIWAAPFTPSCYEPYLESPNGFREVQHFEKSRMEINDPNASPDSLWFVTQGLLAWELITGNMQVGDGAFIHWGPADVHVAGDPDPSAPTYADLAPLMELVPVPIGDPIVATLASDGQVGADPSLAAYGVTSDYFVPETGHAVASVFWEFMTSHGPILVDGAVVDGPLFENPFYGVGLPIAGPHWVRVKVGGVEQDVLVQAFERRVLTYTPDNPEEWRVEAGNVGQHYYMWRYESIPASIDDPCRNTTATVFHIYEPRDGGVWEQVATTRTSEVFHPGGVATGVWRGFTGLESTNWNSAGTMVAIYTPGGIGISKLAGSVAQTEGPVMGTAEIVAENFALGFDDRVGESLLITGNGALSYSAGDQHGVVEFEVAGESITEFHVFLDGPAPPVFFAGP